MQKMCEICHKYILLDFETKQQSSLVTTACSRCLKIIYQDSPTTLERFIQGEEECLIAFDSDAYLITMSKKAQELLNLDLIPPKGTPCGNLLKCDNAEPPGECGKTKSCQSCVMRKVVTAICSTNLIKHEAPISMQLNHQSMSVSITTQKIGTATLVKINKLEAEEHSQ